MAPKITVGDGALGFWKALDEVFPGTHHQRCWLHEVTNVLDIRVRSVTASPYGRSTPGSG